MSKINVFCGPMFSGKSSKIFEIVEETPGNCIIFSPIIDTRSSSFIVCHDGRRLNCMKISKARDMEQYINPSIKAVLIDEAQFFDVSIVEFVKGFSDSGIDVYIFGLDMDRYRRPFGPMPNLMAIADQVTKLVAKCSCGKAAIYSFKVQPDGEQISIGGSDKYFPVCKNCYLENMKKESIV